MDEILAAFEMGHLAEFIKNNDDSELLESCWSDIIESNYDRKPDLVKALIEAGIDCDVRNRYNLTPVEQALALKQQELVTAMLSAEASLHTQQQMVYRLVRRRNVELLNLFFEMINAKQADKFKLVSLALEEIHIKDVPMDQEMMEYCVKLQLNVCYSSVDRMPPGDSQRSVSILERIGIILREIDFLLKYDKVDYNVDAEFMLTLDIVSENMFVIDLLWHRQGLSGLGPRKLWDRLQARKFIYCMAMFKLVQMRGCGLEVCVLWIDKEFLLVLLETLGCELRGIKVFKNRRLIEGEALERDLLQYVGRNDIYVCWSNKFPNHKLSSSILKQVKKRKSRAGLTEQQYVYLQMLIDMVESPQQIRLQWNKLHPNVKLSRKTLHWALETVRKRQDSGRSKPFSEKVSSKTRYGMNLLERLHNGMKNLHSIIKMLCGIEIVKDIALTRENVRFFGYAALRRVTQFVGEYSKSTQDTPNLERTLHNNMSRLSTRQVIKIYEQKRNNLTHGLSLTDVNFRIRCNRGELDSVLMEHCEAVQNDLRKNWKHITLFHECAITKALRSCLNRVARFKSIQQCRSYYAWVRAILPKQIGQVAGLSTFQQMYELLAQLTIHIDCTNHREALRAIHEDLSLAESKELEHRAVLCKYQNSVVSDIFYCTVADNLASVRRKTLTTLQLLQIPFFPSVSLEILRRTNEKVQVLFNKQISPEVNSILHELMRHLAGKEDRQNDMNKFNIHQYVPYQDELYTEGLLNALDVQLETDQFYSIHQALTRKVYNPLSLDHAANVFNVEKKFKIFEQVLKERSIQYNTATLDRLRLEDGRKFQLLFVQMIQSLYELVMAKPSGVTQHDSARILAIDMGLLEICEILSHTRAFQTNFEYLNSPCPPPTGKTIRNILAHDTTLAGSAIICPAETTKLTVQVLYEQRNQLLNTESKYDPVPQFGSIAKKYERRKRLLKEQKVPLSVELDCVMRNCDPRFDIYGQFIHYWKESELVTHNLLDVLIYNYPDEAIAYVEHCSHSDKPIQRSVFYHLWKRLVKSEFLGYHPQQITQSQIESIERSEKFEEMWNRHFGIMGKANFQHPNLVEDAQVFESQIESTLHFCMRTGRLEKFEEMFNRYGKRFDFMAKANFQHPKLVKKLSKVLPWHSVNSMGRNLLHVFCSENNSAALRDALKISKVASLVNEKDSDGVNPIQYAACIGNFGTVEILLNCRSRPPLDSSTLQLIILYHRNDLLAYFTTMFKNTPNIPNVWKFIFRSGNIEALNKLKKILPSKLYKKILSQGSATPALHHALYGQVKPYIIEQFLAVSEISGAIKPSSSGLNPLCTDISVGKFKHVSLLLKHGAIVDFSVIKAAAIANSYRHSKRLYLKIGRSLKDTELIQIIEYILYNNLNEKLLKFFVEKLTTRIVPYQWLEKVIGRHAFKFIKYLCGKFPTIWEEYQRNVAYDPIISALYSTERWNSFRTDKQTIKYLLDQCPNKLQHRALLVNVVRVCDLDTVCYLLDNENMLLEQETNGFTPLALAAYLYIAHKKSNSFSILRALLERGANVRYLLDYKPEYLRHIHLLEMVLQYSTFDPSESHPNVSFSHIACEIGSVRLIKLLVEKYKVNIYGDSATPGTSLGCPLIVSIYSDSFEVLRYLLPRIKDKALLTGCFRTAVCEGKLKSVKLLLQHCPMFKTHMTTLNLFTVLAHDEGQLQVFIYLHSILERTRKMSNL
ncbi:uncharacterized protein LOC131684746 [Topomyia yanbarensis]|uniref:uncharacterized protein LOC131684746 n=1 Tax=Topomyia yanbarensis TaxID=2498891 RepID=UPI00273CA9C3|nr:uncharacterized protein LOC131684746 [Topomyia yanbarensis]